MGQTTPNISIYIPAAGETNYDSSFASGMVNVDQHDHTGAPTKGVQIAATGLADGSVTYPKLNANVADTATGIGVDPVNPNKLQILGLLKELYQLGALLDGELYVGKTGFPAIKTALTAGTGISIVFDALAGSLTIKLGTSADTDFNFTGPVVGGTRSLEVYNTDTANPASDAQISARVYGFGGASAVGDPYLYTAISGTRGVAIGLDNSDADKFKITSSAGVHCTPSSGAECFVVDTASNVTLQATNANTLSLNNATQPGAGAAAGYLNININGSPYVIPLYQPS